MRIRKVAPSLVSLFALGIVFSPSVKADKLEKFEKFENKMKHRSEHGRRASGWNDRAAGISSASVSMDEPSALPELLLSVAGAGMAVLFLRRKRASPLTAAE